MIRKFTYILLSIWLVSCGPKVIEGEDPIEPYDEDEREKYEVFPGTLKKVVFWPDSIGYDGLREMEFYYDSPIERVLSIAKYPDREIYYLDTLVMSSGSFPIKTGSTIAYSNNRQRMNGNGNINFNPGLDKPINHFQYRDWNDKVQWTMLKSGFSEFNSTVQFESSDAKVDISTYKYKEYTLSLNVQSSYDPENFYLLHINGKKIINPLYDIYPIDMDYWSYFWRFHIIQDVPHIFQSTELLVEYETILENGNLKEIVMKKDDVRTVVAEFHWN